jgi:hypothetical protein
VVNHNGTYYHLNPDLVFDVNQIVLCCVCAENPMTKDQESIAAGNDYGQLGSLKPLIGTTRNACVPVRLYNIDLQIRANYSIKPFYCISDEWSCGMFEKIAVFG